MKLNNRGFAITAVLYGLLILFVILVSSYLLILSAKKNRLDNLIEDAENIYNGVSSVDNNIDDNDDELNEDNTPGENSGNNSGDDNSGSNAGGETVPDDTGNGNNTVTTYNINLTSNTGGIVFNPSSPLTVNEGGEVSVSFQVPGGKKFSRIDCRPNITWENDYLMGEVTVIFKNVTSDANCTLYLTNISNGGDASA